jgi:tRNA nucleotidyltransferase (CCA-adding enzyme)
MNARVKVHRRFGTAVIVLSRDFHIDIASSRSEYYTRPGALPTVERSTLRQDLFRRDFTINAMAACIDPDCLGQIADPFGGLRDLEHRTVRVLHALSFVDDPTRVLRAARFEERYGFRMDPATEDQARRAVQLGMLAEVSGARIREELIDIADEERPFDVLRRLLDLDPLHHLVPQGVVARRVPSEIEEVVEALARFESLLPRTPRRRIAILSAVASTGSRAACERWLRHYRFGREYAEVALALAQPTDTLVRTLLDRRGMRDSRLYRLLQPLPLEALVVLWARADALGRDRIERFASTLASVRPEVSGRDLIELGYEPSEAFAAILARVLDDRLDGRVVGREAELANLRRIAARTLGPAPHDKETEAE